MTKRRAAKGTGSIFYDHAGKRWVGKIVIAGTRHRVYGDSRTDAREKLNDVIRHGGRRPADPLKPVAAAAAPGVVTVGAVLATWLQRDVAGRDLAPSTATRHRWAAGLWTDSIGHVSVASLTVNDVEQGLDRIHAGHGLARASLIKCLSTLKQALRFAVRRGYTDRNAAADALVPADARRPVPRQSLRLEEARALLVTLRNTPNGLLWALSLRLGLRPGEAAALHWSDVDLDRGILSVNRSIQLDRAGRARVSDTLKVESSRRSLEMPDDVTAWFREHRAALQVREIGADGGLVFPAADGSPIHPTTARDALADLCTRIGIRAAKPNELRHSCASLLIDQGAAIERVADLLGHNSTRMVDAVYRHRVRPTINTALDVDWTIAK